MADNGTGQDDGIRKKIIMRSPRSPYSRPVQFREINLFSMQAQRIAERSLDRVSYSLFSLEVILQIIGQREVVDEVEDMISEAIAGNDSDLDKENQRLSILHKEAGIPEGGTPHYTNPAKLELEITSPLIMNFVKLLKKLDNAMILIDTLWMNGDMTNQQRVNANHQWHQQLQRLASRIITIESRARKQANRLGKESEVNREAPKQGDNTAATKEDSGDQEDGNDQGDGSGDGATPTPEQEGNAEAVAGNS